jgi:hypothetical protein
MDDYVTDIVLTIINIFPAEITEREEDLFNALPTAEVVSALQKLVYEGVNSTIRSRALDGLLKINDFDKVSFLINLFDENPKWRTTCCKRLMDFPDKRAIIKLCEVIIQDNDPTVRFAAAEALGEIGDESAIAFLEHVNAADTGVNWEEFPVAQAANEAIKIIQMRMRTA